jgi:glycosyltransferase involved in cell wall biosynthesis
MAIHNGAKTLPDVLDSYCKLDSPNGGWKLVIVDNGSTDNTKEIIFSFRSRLPLTYVFEPKLGKSAALNTGLRSIEGDLVVMTDDDALPRPDWLAQMRDAADSQPSFAIFAGAIIPHWAVPPEDWILKFQNGTLAITDPAWEEGPLVGARVFGPNMAVRSEVIKAGYRFDVSVGPVGGRYRMGEEADFFQVLRKAGFTQWHCKRAVVAHMILREHMNKKWVLRRAAPAGGADYRRELRDGPYYSPKLLFGMPRYLIREILAQAIRFGRAMLFQDADTIFMERWRLHYLAGRAIEGRYLHRTQ